MGARVVLAGTELDLAPLVCPSDVVDEVEVDPTEVLTGAPCSVTAAGWLVAVLTMDETEVMELAVDDCP